MLHESKRKVRIIGTDSLTVVLCAILACSIFPERRTQLYIRHKLATGAVDSSVLTLPVSKLVFAQ